MRAEHEREFDEFVRATSDRSYRLAIAVLRDPAAARGALEETYAAVFSRWRRWRRRDDREALLLQQLVATMLARTPTARPSEPRAAAPDEQVVDVDTVWAALADVSIQQRTVLALRHREDLSDAEIALCLGLAAESVESRVAESMAALRQVLITPGPRQRV